MPKSLVQAVADEIADEIWKLVDDIRAEAGHAMTRDDEKRVLTIRQTLRRRLAAMAELPA
jgi:hypothetical protein